MSFRVRSPCGSTCEAVRAQRPGLCSYPGKRASIIAFAIMVTWVTSVDGQTFAQLTDLGENVGPRLTRAVTLNRINKKLFGRIGTKVSFINNGVIYQFATDPDWGRVLIGNWDMWVHGYNNAGGPGGPLGQAEGIDISARRHVYVADRDHGRVVIATFDLNLGNLVNPSTLTSSFLVRPIDVAWDGGSSPLGTDYLYIVDDSTSSVTYWSFNGGTPSSPLWSYGTKGAGTGQFWHPTGVCVGKTAGSTGGTQFTSYFYVVDRGNKRVVWLTGGTGGATWQGVASVTGWDPVDCAVDHFGNVYVVDWGGHRIHKFDLVLSLLASYGTYGNGANNLNTFAFPHAISVPCGLKVVNSQTVWYCEGRVVTAELWSDSSGAVEHYLGVDGQILNGPTVSATSASINYSSTDHAYNTILVEGANGMATVVNNRLYSAGWWGADWQGHLDNGSVAPDGYYRFNISLQSAYGCPNNFAYPWCLHTLISNQFYFHYCPPGGKGCPPLQAPPAGVSLTDPTTLFLEQRILIEPRSLARVSGPALTALRERAGAAVGEAPTAPGALRDAVRKYGVRGLSFSVTQAAAAVPVEIRVYSLSGRLIRTLVSQRLDPGVYEIGWDGNDDRG